MANNHTHVSTTDEQAATESIEKKENNASRKRKLSPTTPSSKDAKVETKSDTPPPERPCRQSSAANFSQHCAMFRPIKDSDDAKMETELDPPKSLITTNTGDEKIKAETTTDNPPKRRAVESYRDPISGKLKPTAVAVRPSLAPSPPAPLEPTKSQAAELSQGSQSSIFAPAPLSPGEQTNSNSSQHCYGGHGQTPSPRLS